MHFRNDNEYESENKYTNININKNDNDNDNDNEIKKKDPEYSSNIILFDERLTQNKHDIKELFDLNIKNQSNVYDLN